VRALEILSAMGAVDGFLREGYALPGLNVRVFFPMLLNLDGFQHKMRDTLAEINVAYPKSALSEDHAGSNGPVAGDRAPDALLVRMPSRRTEHLFDVLRGPRWTLLLFAGIEPKPDEIESLEKIGGSLAGRYGKRVEIHLILCGDPPVPVHENWASDVLMDRERQTHDKYGVDTAPCLYLIRPDWQVAFRGGLESAKNLSAYLERVLG
jgi:hypothetical protein